MYTLIDKCEMVYHLAAAVGVQLIVDEPVRTIETNIRGTEIVLGVAKKFGKKVVLASTSEVYGKNGNVPFKEDDDCLLGSTTFSRWSYACSKAIDEFLGLAYYRQHGLPVLIVRLFNTVGERQTGQYGMVIPRFVKAALAAEPLMVYGDGKQTRCFAYVQDVIDGLIALADDSTAYGDVYNIGATEEVSIEDLARMIKNMTRSPSQIRYVPYEEAYGRAFDDMRRRVPSVEKIRGKVGYSPKTSLKETLEIIVNHFRMELNSAS
jgi:UDP-glucose 4-epimerase